MVVPFGFSAGDIAMAIQVVVKVAQGLKNSGGSASEYQDIIKYLQSLLLTLQHLETLRSKTKDESIAKAVEALASAAQKPMLEFMEDIRKYEVTLGQKSSSNSIRSGFHKTDWALRIAKKGVKLRANISAELESLHLLLGSQSLYASYSSCFLIRTNVLI